MATPSLFWGCTPTTEGGIRMRCAKPSSSRRLKMDLAVFTIPALSALLISSASLTSTVDITSALRIHAVNYIAAGQKNYGKETLTSMKLIT
jgi:hypothetical protein